MEIVVKSRHMECGEAFRQHAIDKLERIERLDHRVIRLDVEVSKEHNPRLSSVCERVELTCRSRGPVVRAEAAAEDVYAALDVAIDKLEARLRRAADRRRVHHGSRTPVSVGTAVSVATTVASDGQAAAAPARRAAAATAVTVGSDGHRRGTAIADGLSMLVAEPEHDGAGHLDEVAAKYDGGPDGAHEVPVGNLVVREKRHESVPMSLDQALFEMELVGHDFYLYRDSGCGLPSVVYRRRGYDYGVIRLA